MIYEYKHIHYVCVYIQTYSRYKYWCMTCPLSPPHHFVIQFPSFLQLPFFKFLPLTSFLSSVSFVFGATIGGPLCEFGSQSSIQMGCKWHRQLAQLKRPRSTQVPQVSKAALQVTCACLKKNMHVSTHATFINIFIKIDPPPPSSSPKQHGAPFLLCR